MGSMRRMTRLTEFLAQEASEATAHKLLGSIDLVDPAQPSNGGGERGVGATGVPSPAPSRAQIPVRQT